LTIDGIFIYLSLNIKRAVGGVIQTPEFWEDLMWMRKSFEPVKAQQRMRLSKGR
jgi:hypothetical protein